MINSNEQRLPMLFTSKFSRSICFAFAALLICSVLVAGDVNEDVKNLGNEVGEKVKGIGDKIKEATTTEVRLGHILRMGEELTYFYELLRNNISVKKS